MSHINQIVLSGRLTADPTIRGGGSVCVLPLASNRQFQQNNEWQNDVVYIDATCFSFNAQKCSGKLMKGDEVTVTGRLELNQYEAQDGSQRRVIRIVVSTVESPAFLSGWARQARQSQGLDEAVTGRITESADLASEPLSVTPSVATDDDIPF